MFKFQKINYKRLSSPRAESGFTLIELLVVIAIIGMLSSVVLASMNTARKKARDARRMADAKGLQTALELFYDDGNTYATAGGSVSTVLTGLVSAGSISSLPKDPSNTGSNGYQYGATTPVYGYAIAIKKENGGWCQFKEGAGYALFDTGNYPICSQ